MLSGAKEGVGIVIWDFKEQEGNSYQDRKDNGTQRELSSI